MSVINALFLGMGKVIPYFKMTPEIAQQLNKNLAKVMMYVKSKGITLTQKQQDYITGQTKQLDMYEQSITPPTAKGPKATVTDITERLGPEAPYSTKNPEGWMPTEGEESAMQARGIMSEMGFNQNIVDDTINLLKDKDPKSLSDELKNIMLKKGTYADYNDAERKAVLDGIQKIMESRGGHLNFATGGRVGFSKGKLAKKGLEYALEKLGKQVTTADKIDRPEKAKLKEMFDDFNKRFKEKTTNTEITLPSGIKGSIDTTYEPKIKKFEGMSKIILSPEEAIKLAKKEKLEGIESLLSGEKVALSRGAGKGLMVNHNGKIFIREKIKDRPNPIKEDEKAIIEEVDAMFDEEPVQMSMDDLIKYRSENPAGKGRFTRAEAIIARLENTIQGAKDNPDETSDYVLKNFPNMIEELKNKPELANNENVWKELGMTGLPENQRFKIYDDGTVDFETLKPTHTFKLKEEIKRKLNASGGLNYLMGL